jgi:hypothetical protein
MPYFGPLSADEPTLKGLSKREALTSIRGRIRQQIKEIAPPKPDKQFPHNPFHKETGPWLCLGIGPGGPKYAGCWYQIVRLFNHATCSSSNYFPVVQHV